MTRETLEPPRSAGAEIVTTRDGRSAVALLREIAGAAAGENDLGRILAGALDRLAGEVAFTGGSIALVEGEALVVRAAVGPFAADAMGERLPRGRGRAWEVLETRRSFITGDLRAVGLRIADGTRPIRSWLAVPLLWQEAVIGLLEVDSTERDAFDEEDRTLVEGVAAVLSGTIEMARRYAAEVDARAAASAAAQRTARLQSITAALSEAVTVGDVANVVLGQGLEALGASAGTVALLRPEEPGTAEIAAAAGYPAEVLARWTQFPADPSTPLALAVTEGTPVFIESLAELDRRFPATSRDARASGHRALAAYPLTVEGRSIGAIGLSFDESRSFDDAERAFLVALAQQCTQALERARLYEAERTARADAEAAVRELTRFRTTLDASLDGVFVFDPVTLRFSYANLGAASSLGYDRQELLGMTPVDLKVEFDENRFRALIEPLLAGRSPSVTFTTTHRHRGGALVPVEVVLQYVAPENEPPRMVMIARDITDRVEAQARLQRLAQSERALSAELRAIIRAMGDAVLVFAPDGRLLFANPAAETLFPGGAIERFEDLRGRMEDPGAVPPPGVRDAAGPIEVRTREDEERWLEVSAYPVLAATDAVSDSDREDRVETILFMRDVTESRLARMARDAFIGVLSHELRTPVTTIYGNSKLIARIERGRPEEVRREVFADIETEAERLYRLVEDLLVLARFGDEGRPSDLGREPLLLQRIVPAVIGSEEARWPETRFDVDLEAGLPPAQGDQTYVEQVVRNLVNNAAKYGGPESVVGVEVRSTADEVRVCVLDEGPGFPSDEAGRLFDLFYRSPHTAGRASGAGIGLFVCRRLIEAMDGRIWARPRPSGGSEFGFALKVFSEEEV